MTSPSPSPAEGVSASSAGILELCADDDVAGLRVLLAEDPSAADHALPWYTPRTRSLSLHTPLMVSAAYGSLSVLRFLLSLPSVDVNRRLPPDLFTPLHCAAGGGTPSSLAAASLLLAAGADPLLPDSSNLLPSDVVAAPPHFPHLKLAFLQLLSNRDLSSPLSNPIDSIFSCAKDTTSHSTLSAKDAASLLAPKDAMDAATETVSSKEASVAGVKEYPVDPTMPDIKNGVYATDDFRMYSFKIRACSRAYSHDWTECPFAHPGENARRRDPRKYHYSCVPCPEYRKGGSGVCRRGDLCEYAHGVFESWLHPAQYRTRMCKDGSACARRVCFFAHSAEELRPLLMSGLVPSPPFTPPLSPSANGGGGGAGAWLPQSNVPVLHLPGSNLQLSRLRTSLNARDMLLDEFLQDTDAQMISEFGNGGYARVGSPSVRTGSARGKVMMPSNLDDLFSAVSEVGSPRYGGGAEQAAAGAVFSPTHRTAILNQFQQQQSLLSPINTRHHVFSPKIGDGLSSSFPGNGINIGSPGRMSPRSFDNCSPVSVGRLAAYAKWERERQHQALRSMSSKDFTTGSSFPVGSPTGASSLAPWTPIGQSLPGGSGPDWVANGDELGRLRRSSSFELRSGDGEEPDLSWVHSLVKETTPEKLEAADSDGHDNGHDGNGGDEEDEDAAVIGAWLDQLQLESMTV